VSSAASARAESSTTSGAKPGATTASRRASGASTRLAKPSALVVAGGSRELAPDGSPPSRRVDPVASGATEGAADGRAPRAHEHTERPPHLESDRRQHGVLDHRTQIDAGDDVEAGRLRRFRWRESIALGPGLDASNRGRGEDADREDPRLRRLQNEAPSGIHRRARHPDSAPRVVSVPAVVGSARAIDQLDLEPCRCPVRVRDRAAEGWALGEE
jgi:hypothetical protein